MALYKRSPGGPWWVRFSVGSKVIRRSSGTTDKKDAAEYETALRHRYWRQAKLGESVHTWREAVVRYKQESSWRESTRKRNVYALSFFVRLDSIAVQAITSDVTRAARQFVERTQSPASANRIMSVMRAVLRSCVRWGWTTHVPQIAFASVPQHEPAWVRPDQFAMLMSELPEHLRAPASFAVLTGMRLANVRDLTWDRVDLENGHVTIPASQYKGKRDIGLPLSTQAVAVLKSLPHRRGRVFLYDGKPITGTFNTRAFRLARKRAGVAGVRWHDLRHTFASWLAAGGASDRVLQSLGGWSSPRMVSRYAHLRPSDLRPYADAVGTIMDTALSNSSFKNSENSNQIMVPGRGLEPPTRALRMRAAMKRVK
jgi:integrase